MTAENKDILVNIIKFPAILAGLWKRSQTNSLFLNKIFYAYSLLARIIYFVYYISVVAELLRLITKKYETEVIMSSFSVVVNSTIILLKIIIYLKNNIFELYNDVIEREREIWRRNDSEIIKIYLKKCQMGKLFNVLLIVATAITLFTLNVARLYGNAQLRKYNEAHNKSLESNFHVQFWFPGNKLEHEPVVLFLNLLISYTTLIGNITTHVALITLLVYLVAHLAILQYGLKHYIPNHFNKESMDDIILVLKSFIVEHQYLIEFTRKLNEGCKNIVLMEFLLSSFDCASVTLNVIKLGLAEMVWSGTFLGLLVIQTFCLAWSCNEINVQSQAIAVAAFESNWQLLNKDGKQLTQLMIHYAQERPLMMTIGSFGPMTLASFLAIWKIAYSYFSVMTK